MSGFSSGRYLLLVALVLSPFLVGAAQDIVHLNTIPPKSETRTVTVTMTGAELADSFANPIEILPAPGIGKVIIPMWQSGFTEYLGVPFDALFQLQYAGPTPGADSNPYGTFVSANRVVSGHGIPIAASYTGFTLSEVTNTALQFAALEDISGVGGLGTVIINSGGASFSVGDVVSLVGSTTFPVDPDGYLQVASVDGSGQVLTATVVVPSGGYEIGSDDPFDVNLSRQLYSAVLNAAGTGFASGDTGYILPDGDLGTITGVNQGTKTFTTSEAWDPFVYPFILVAGQTLALPNSTGNDGLYTLVSAQNAGGFLSVTVSEAIPSAVADGDLAVVATYVVNTVGGGGAITGLTVDLSTRVKRGLFYPADARDLVPFGSQPGSGVNATVNTLCGNVAGSLMTATSIIPPTTNLTLTVQYQILDTEP